jgi:AraC-like DNA-binding protein
VLLNQGDLVILTESQAHALRDDPQSPVEPLARLLQRYPLDRRKNFVWENGGAETTMLCGGFHLEERRASPLLATLAPTLIVRDNGSSGFSLRAAFELVEAELLHGGPGSEALVSRLSDAIFLQAIRATFFARDGRAPRWLAALHDSLIGESLILMHQRLREPWTVESLASKIGMSRSAFSSRFVQLLGEAPMTYLARWRLNRAAFALRTGNAKISAIADLVGYDSEASLSKAFKRCFGLSPGTYRRHWAVANGCSEVPPPNEDDSFHGS